MAQSLLTFFFSLCLLAQLLTAQTPPTVWVANYSGQEFDGWKRATVPTPLPPSTPESANFIDNPGCYYVLGRPLGLSARVIDVHVRIPPGTVKPLSFAQQNLAPRTFVRLPPPQDPLAFFGAPSIAGIPFILSSVAADGAAYSAKFSTRLPQSPMFCVNMWLNWYPDQPEFAVGELLTVASNPLLPQVTAQVPPNFLLKFGPADVFIPGLTVNPQEILPHGMQFGDGQCRAFPLTLIWKSRITSPAAFALANMGICANGLSSALYPPPVGSPLSATALPRPMEWARSKWPEAINSLHSLSWDLPDSMGVGKTSGATGAQPDQMFPGYEASSAQMPFGLGSEVVYYLVALGQSRRPCHHLEANGDLLNLANHPNLRMWDGRAHWHLGVSPDQLGKSQQLNSLLTWGWCGPDVEHALFNTLVLSYRLTGSPTCQFQIQANSRVYLRQWTNDPGASTSSVYAARSIGYEGILAVYFYDTLEDRILAEQVKQNWLARFDRIVQPAVSQAPNSIWDVRTDDPRLGPGAWWIPWQQALGAYGLDLAGLTFNRPAARSLALDAARRVVSDAWLRSADNTHWSPVPSQSVSGNLGKLDDPFQFFGMSMAPAIVAARDPSSELGVKARAIMAQLKNEGTHTPETQWLPPNYAR